MKNQIFLALAFMCLITSAQAQQNNLFTKKSDLARDYHSIAKKYEIMSLDKQKLSQIKNSGTQQLILELPFEGKIMKLELQKVSVVMPGFEVIEQGAGGKITKSNYQPGVLYQGKITGEIKSFVTFSFFDDQVYGIMSDSKSNITLGGLETNGIASSDYVIYRDSELKVNNPFTCATPETPIDPTNSSTITPNQKGITTSRTNFVNEPVEIYYECDYAFYQNKGSVANVVNYVLAFFNTVQLLYANENVQVQVSQIKVWTTPDPYAGLSSTSSILGAFAPNMASDPYKGDYAHFLTTRSVGGGVAYLLNNPCASSRQNRTAVSGIQSSYQNFPTYSWTVEVTTHEQGHNFGSNHTQWCGWTGGALDNCYTTEGGCAAGPAPTNGGTIMSYCHLTSSGINFNNGFGQLPGDKIRTVLGNAACFAACRMTLGITKSDAGCGQNNGSITITPVNGTAPYTYIWSDGQSTATASNLAPGTYYVSVKDAVNCEVMGQAVIANNGTSLSITVTPSGTAAFCTGGSVLLTSTNNASYTYQWRKDGNPISGATSNTYTATTTGSYTVQVISGACNTTTTAVNVVEVATPSASITAAGLTTFCNGGNVILNANTGSGLQYQWLKDGTPITGATNSSYTATTSGNYTVRVSAGTCQTTSTATAVTVNPVPSATITAGGALTFCAPGTVVLNANTGTGYTYQWSRDGTAIGGATTNSYTTNTSGSYTVKVSSAGCESTSAASVVTVYAVPTATITAGGATTFCNGSSVTLSANTGSGLQYQWYRDGSLINGATSSSYLATITGNYTVNVAAGNCQATSSGTTVTANPAPSATITAGGPVSFCQGGNVTLNANTSTGYSYQWFRDGSVIAGATNGSYSAGVSGNYTVGVTSNSCQTISSATPVTVNALPNSSVTANGSLSFCQGNSVILNVSTGSGLQYQWYRDGSAISGATNNSYTATTSGNYTVTVSAGSCQSTSTSNIVTASPAPTASITATGALVFCQGGSVLLNASTGTGYTYQWLRDGSAISGATNISYSATISGNYTVTVGSNGCAATSTATAVNVAAAPNSTVTANGALSFCQGGSVLLTATTGTGYTYQWFRDGASITGATTNSYTATITGNYTITISNGSCQATSSSNNVTVNVPPVANIAAGGTASFCQGGSVTLSATTGTGYTYQWFRDGVTISGATQSNYAAASTGGYTVQVSLGGCSRTSVATNVTVLPAPVITLTPTLSTIEKFQTQTFTAGGAVTYNWSVQPFVITSNGNMAVVRPLTTTTYTIEGTGTNGCKAIRSATVNVIGCGIATNFKSTVLSPSRVVISWVNPEGSTGDSLQYRVLGTNNWTSVYVNGQQYLLNNLNPNTDYEYRVKPLCSTTNVFLASTVSTFKTSSLVGEVYLKLYPNPVTDFVNVEMVVDKDFKLKIDIFNQHGQKVLNAVNGESNVAGTVLKNINVSRLRAGMYTVVVQINEKIYSLKMVIAR